MPHAHARGFPLAMLRIIQRSRGTGPRATVARPSPFTVGRGPVPRHAAVYPTIAGDRPPRYGKGGDFRRKNRDQEVSPTGKLGLSHPQQQDKRNLK